MSESTNQNKSPLAEVLEKEKSKNTNQGKVSIWLSKNQLKNKPLGFDHQGVEIIEIEADDLLSVGRALFKYGFNYLRSQLAYDSEPGGPLVSVYHLVQLSDNADQPEEVCLKVFLPRNNPKIASVFAIWKTADFQERESYDMYGIVYEGHPHLKRILLPEYWVGWPMRKDYVTPEFYELQDAY